eukprot:sb/3466738/
MKGKGTENTDNYRNTKLTYLDMANIHAIRESSNKLTALCSARCQGKSLSRLEHTGWLGHVSGMLSGAVQVSHHLAAGGPALVHCSDGWDRTSQLTSLGLILVDPYYRTHEGIQVLIEREWLSFGHRFHDRLGLGHADQRSPIFSLFLDGLYQIMSQFGRYFQFTSQLLLVLFDLHGSGWTSSFLRNCPSERTDSHLLPIWDILDGMRDELTNPLYQETQSPLSPRVSLRHMLLWRENYLRYDLWREQNEPEKGDAVVWVRDSDAPNCHNCKEKFSTLKLRMRHHCRLCGNVFCGNCAKNKICVPDKNLVSPALVCVKCYREHSGK